MSYKNGPKGLTVRYCCKKNSIRYYCLSDFPRTIAGKIN